MLEKNDELYSRNVSISSAVPLDVLFELDLLHKGSHRPLIGMRPNYDRTTCIVGDMVLQVV